MTAKANDSEGAKWRDYRMWRQRMSVTSAGGNSAESAGDWTPTGITFRARSQDEAQRKADRFWRNAELGAGSMICIPDGEQLRLDHARNRS